MSALGEVQSLSTTRASYPVTFINVEEAQNELFRKSPALKSKPQGTEADLVPDVIGGYLGSPWSISPVAARFKARTKEREWRRTHESELLRYAGEWVVLEGEIIVAHNVAADLAVEDARACGISAPYVFFVEPRLNPMEARLGL